MTGQPVTNSPPYFEGEFAIWIAAWEGGRTIRNTAAVEMGRSLDVIVLFIASLALGVTVASVAPPSAPIETLPPPETIWANS